VFFLSFYVKFKLNVTDLERNGPFSVGDPYVTFRENISVLEERKPTRCNNIDGLLSIMGVDY